jgi:hypothetical protein
MYVHNFTSMMRTDYCVKQKNQVWNYLRVEYIWFICHLLDGVIISGYVVLKDVQRTTTWEEYVKKKRWWLHGKYCHDLGVCVTYRRDMDWMLHLLASCIRHSELHFTDDWHTHRLVTSVYIPH